MKVIEHLAQAIRTKQPRVSFEIIPPKRGASLENLEKVVKDLAQFSPPFIDVTSRAAEPLSSTGEVQIQKYMRKSPGTLGICVLIKHKHRIDPVPHVLCQGFTREETEDFLLELSYCGVENVLALRGDDLGYEKPLANGKTRNVFTQELVGQIENLRKGAYLHGQGSLLDFCVGVGGYPEKHAQAVDFASDIHYTQQKVDAGADYIVTQMFFDNSSYFTYLANCRNAGITVPIIPGLKILTSKEQVDILQNTFHCRIPKELAGLVERAGSNEEVKDIGCEWAVRQARELFAFGYPVVHFYVMLNVEPIRKVMGQLKENGILCY
ncbi:methylenetetrahydrofolate reductase [Candidatus Woesearchaeota archaeon]|nr:methylenetetrahydrofolate reductase [Candidatus Woesearchaeota archaeon]